MQQLALHVDKNYAGNSIRAVVPWLGPNLGRRLSFLNRAASDAGAAQRPAGLAGGNKHAQSASLASLASDLAPAGPLQGRPHVADSRRGAAGILLNNPALAVTAYADRPP
jgi:hypothetical protein